jgi:hypothetical protein
MTLEPAGEILHGCFRHQRIIRRDAGLAGIEQFSVGDALGGLVEIGGAVDDRGRFATEFERAGVRLRPAASATRRPTRVEPVKTR